MASKIIKGSSHIYTSASDEPIISLKSGLNKTLNLDGTITVNGAEITSSGILSNDIIALTPSADCTVYDNCTASLTMGDLSTSVTIGASATNDTDIVLNGPTEIVTNASGLGPIFNGFSSGTKLILQSVNISPTNAPLALGVDTFEGASRMFFGLDGLNPGSSFDFYAGITRLCRLEPSLSGDDNGLLTIGRVNTDFLTSTGSINGNTVTGDTVTGDTLVTAPTISATSTVTTNFELNGTNISISGPLLDDVLKYDGTEFVSKPSHISVIEQYGFNEQSVLQSYNLYGPSSGSFSNIWRLFTTLTLSNQEVFVSASEGISDGPLEPFPDYHAINYYTISEGVATHVSIDTSFDDLTPKFMGQISSSEIITIDDDSGTLYSTLERVERRSTDGMLTWTTLSPAFATTDIATSASYKLGAMIYTLSSGTGRIRLYTGTTFSSITTADALALSDSLYSETLGLFVIIGPNSTSAVFTSPDGITWTSRTTPNTTCSRLVETNNGLIAYISSNGTSTTVVRSSDAITWVSETVTGYTGLRIVFDSVQRVLLSSNGYCSVDDFVTSETSLSGTQLNDLGREIHYSSINNDFIYWNFYSETPQEGTLTSFIKTGILLLDQINLSVTDINCSNIETFNLETYTLEVSELIVLDIPITTLNTIDNSFLQYNSITEQYEPVNEVETTKVVTTGDYKVSDTVNTNLDLEPSGIYTKGDVVLDSASTNTLFFRNSITLGAGLELPTFLNRSAGTKVCWNPSITTNITDFATGMANQTLWNSVGETSDRFEWYGGITKAMTLEGSGELTVGRTVCTEVNKVGSSNNPDQTVGALNVNGDILFNDSGTNLLFYYNGGSGIPTLTTRSNGTKIVYGPELSGFLVDYATGVASSTLWNSVPGTNQRFEWYGGTTKAMTLSGAGQISCNQRRLGVYSNSVIAVNPQSNGYFPLIEYDTTGGYWGPGPYNITNTSGLVKVWLVSYTIFWEGIGSGLRLTYIQNNTGTQRYAMSQTDVVNQELITSGSATIVVQPGDVLRVICYQDTGVSVNMGSTNLSYKNRFTMYELP